jgi:hypothetical protein
VISKRTCVDMAYAVMRTHLSEFVMEGMDLYGLHTVCSLVIIFRRR